MPLAVKARVFALAATIYSSKVSTTTNETVLLKGRHSAILTLSPILASMQGGL
jgi:hypothetical protein